MICVGKSLDLRTGSSVPEAVPQQQRVTDIKSAATGASVRLINTLQTGLLLGRWVAGVKGGGLTAVLHRMRQTLELPLPLAFLPTSAGRRRIPRTAQERAGSRPSVRELRLGGIFLDLLSQTVDVGLERVGGDSGIVAPDLSQRVSPNRLLSRTIEIAQDLAFLLGQADSVPSLRCTSLSVALKVKGPIVRTACSLFSK